MRIPVFHDDQHGTAVVVSAAILNGLEVVGKAIADCKLVVSGAGAAALACLDLLLDVGFRREQIWVTDIEGVVWEGRPVLMDEEKARFAQPTDARVLDDVIADADIFLGLSAGGVLKPAMVAKMAPRPLILALANPTPEILPEEVRSVRDDAVIATGRSDYPNQVNNVLVFPFLFRGALDVGATTINRAMEIAAVKAVADLARAEQSEVTAAAYGSMGAAFGPDYIIPRPFDPRLIVKIAPEVARAAMESGVATRPITDFDSYRAQLEQFVYHSGNFMKPIFSAARRGESRRIMYAEGEDERVLRCAQQAVDEKLARPILIGRPAVLERRIERFGLRIRLGQDVDVVNPEWDERFAEYWRLYHQLTARKGVSPAYAQIEVRRRNTLIGALMVRRGEADGMLCGTFGLYTQHLHYIDQVIGRRPNASVYAAMNTLMLPGRQVTLVDTHVNADPDASQLAEITLMAAEELRRIGVKPSVALLSHSNFGSSDLPSARKMRETLTLLRSRAPELEVDGEMHGDAALNAAHRRTLMPDTTLSGDANLLVMPNIDAANISYNLLKTAAGNGVAIGPVLLGAAAPIHILTAAATVRRLVNMTAWTVSEINAGR
jgi:malate dehydrogenase (oxaloacetate-decarboxylating)(NADP+)